MEAMRCVAMKKQFPIISFEHASFQYEGQSQESLKDVKLIIKSGEFLVITGQSGCGKTTLTRCINNLIPRFFEGRLSGEVIVLGRSIKESDAGEAGKEIASIFQDPRSQFFTTNSSSEVAFACENYGIPHKEIVKRVNSAFQSLNMENLKDRDIFALSSGERQKVAFLAATTLNPQIYVLDEPSANSYNLTGKRDSFCFESRWTHDYCFRTQIVLLIRTRRSLFNYGGWSNLRRINR